MNMKNNTQYPSKATGRLVSGNPITRLIALALLLAGSLSSQAKPRTQAQMEQAAAKVINMQMGRMHKAPRKGQLKQLAEKGHLTVMGFADGGFAIVTDDDLLPAIVGYSDKSYDAELRNDGFQWWLSAMQDATAYYINNK